MKVFDLRCAHGHVFEGWFASSEDYQSQCQRGLLQCPVCGSAQVDKLLSAPHLKAKSNRQPSAEPQRLPAGGDQAPSQVQARGAPSAGAQQAMAEQRRRQAQWLSQARALLKNAENVGERFTAEARRIHEGQAPERPIHGQASVQQMLQLLDEGIPVLPLPEGADEPLQ
ncbi:DUF1178 family protein [Vandammella animalimorsus]|uniref:DUF1178 family protein n=1 Tax=Vandammella animalimorsus TaxID=2029117 RepID=A0A2A2AKG8_9BURK|nr:DUF1178 family protein [Vandammella animalimorsus]PAT38316.1 hypothetical protein CK625_02155 [Vandammella animalimorsus]